AAIAAEHRHSAWLLDRHRPDPAHRAIHGPTHLDRGTHARRCAPWLRELHAAGPIPDRSGRVVSAHERAAMLDPHMVRRAVLRLTPQAFIAKGVERRSRQGNRT